MSTASTPTAALSASLAQPGARARFRIPGRPLKLFGSAALACAGAYGILSEQQYVTSSNAIVSAYVLDIRTPIEGTVSALPQSPGATVAPGALLGHVANPLADHQHLDNLRTLEDVAQSTAQADATETTALAGQQRALLGRAAAHSVAVTARLRLAGAEQQSTLDAAESRLHQARTELGRGRSLHDEGILPTADFDKLVSNEAIARHQLEAERSTLASLRAQTEAAGHGLLSEPGTNNDVAYSRQRADELAIKLAETQRSLAASRAQAAEAHAAVLAEAARSASLEATDLRSPIAGVVWQIEAIDGEIAALNTPVLSLVDCSRQFLLVEVPQDRLPDIAIGGTAQFKLTGESVERTGIVEAATGDPQKEINHKFAAFPVQDTSEQLATVRVSLSEPVPSCTVGRTARVLLPTQPTNRLTRTLRQYF